jgi:ferredoxin
VAAAAQQRRRRRSVAAHAKVELRDLDGKLHILEVSEDQNILEVALDEGLDMPYDCKMGVCL